MGNGRELISTGSASTTISPSFKSSITHATQFECHETKMEALKQCFETVRGIDKEYTNKLVSAFGSDSLAEHIVDRDKDAEKFISKEMRVRAGQSLGVRPEEVIALW